MPQLVAAEMPICPSVSAFTKSDGFPWPWSYQCEFDWKSIEGRWQVGGVTNGTYYEIEVFEAGMTDEKFLLIIQYDSKHEVLARGLALHPELDKSVVVPMRWSEGVGEPTGFWVHISWISEASLATTESKKTLCEETENRFLAIKKTTFGKVQDDKEPKILEKKEKLEP